MAHHFSGTPTLMEGQHAGTVVTELLRLRGVDGAVLALRTAVAERSRAIGLLVVDARLGQLRRLARVDHETSVAGLRLRGALVLEVSRHLSLTSLVDQDHQPFTYDCGSLGARNFASVLSAA